MKEMGRSKRRLSEKTVVVLILLTMLTGCVSKEKIGESVEQAVKDTLGTDGSQVMEAIEEVAGAMSQPDGLPDGFPSEIPFYDGADIISTDSFNGNHYTVVYNVTANFDDVAAYYEEALSLDGYGIGQGEAYYEGIPMESVVIDGLTIEDIGDGVNVYMTVHDEEQAMVLEQDASADEAASTGYSGISIYDTAEKGEVDSSYPQDLVPVHPDGKSIECSMVPGTRSGFASYVMPGELFGEMVSYYEDALGLMNQGSGEGLQEAAGFSGEIDNVTVSVLITHLYSQENDTFIKIVLSEN